MIRVGILGFGFMGRMHFDCYARRDDCRIVAICDANPEGVQVDRAVGNVAQTTESLDLSGVEILGDFERMMDTVKMDALSITLPTFLHREYTCRALDRGIPVLCEKPMALCLPDCDAMIHTAERCGKVLQIGHCIRFWPEYAKAKELLDTGRYGEILSLSLRRLSARPTWSHEDWLMNTDRSGGMELDLHIHDSDYVQHLLGMPKAVFSAGVKGGGDHLDYITTQYLYEQNVAISAEGTWTMAPSFGFEMSFHLVAAGATIVFDSTRDPAFRVCPAEGEAFTPSLVPGDGYDWELDHFLRTVQGEDLPAVTTLESARDSVRLVEAERRSALKGEIVSLDSP